MTIVTCSLSHPIHLIIPPIRFQKAAEEYPEAIPPNQNTVAVDLQELSTSGVPTLVGKAWNKPQVIFCTRRYEIACGLTSQEDGYFVQHISPLSLRSHNQIARHMVALKVPRWHLHGELTDLGRWARETGKAPQSGFADIKAKWEQVEQAGQPSSDQKEMLTPAHLAFLSDVETLIDLAYQVELKQATRREVTSVLGAPKLVAQASWAGDVYTFTLTTPTDLQVGDYVKVGAGDSSEHGAGYVGVVTEVTQRAVTVRFHHQVDLSELKRVEWLLPWISGRQYDIQKEALTALRKGQSVNPHVLRLIVDGYFIPYQEISRDGQGLEKLNQTQQRMIARAEQVPDLLLALGPPGTGKTHTIRAIVAQQVAQDKRVLVTSKNNKAVDNILETLKGVDVLRIGREEAISGEARRLMIDERARELQGQILTNISPTLTGLDTVEDLWPQLDNMLSDLTRCAADWGQTQTRYQQEREALTNWQRARYADVKPVIEHQLHHVQTLRKQATQASNQTIRWSIVLTFIWSLTHLPGLGAIFVIIAAWLDRHWQQAAQPYWQATRQLKQVTNQIRQIWQAYRDTVCTSEEALRRKYAVARLEETLVKLHIDSTHQAARLDEITARFEQIPFSGGVPSLRQATGSPETLKEACRQFEDWHKALAPKRSLLHDWQALLQARHQALYPTLIKMVNVVGATCIGIATDANFEDLEFDLVIADEVGQIQVMDLLVPLVRAKRAVLVGDHRQLPPVVEDEIAKRIDPDNEAQLAWIEQSLFEQLFERQSTPETHKIMLDTQYRMPKPIADFISRQFYKGKYRTGREVAHSDPFFDGPIVFIDTMQENNRRERPVIEPEGLRGYTNDLEARLISQVVLAYQTHGDVWGVIVPYKKQAERVRQELRRLRQTFSPDLLNDWVATVDSFQGKERDVIIYGFTRSNPRRQVGFMADLRRLNVSLTRTRRQLVLIGDSTTLAQAGDAPFAKVMQDLLQMVKTSPGGYLHAREIQQRLKI